GQGPMPSGSRVSSGSSARRPSASASRSRPRRPSDGMVRQGPHGDYARGCDCWYARLSRSVETWV
ncbi:MAG: hypothetical protein ACK559_23550, partial [bacterium]